MANIAIFRINYKSDFILTLNSDAGWMTPFCIKFWTGAPSQAYFVGFDGTTYTHCAPVDGEPTKLRVQFDDHHLPIGDLKFQIAYHFTVADFPTSVEDEVLNQASVIIEVDDAPAQVMLDFNGETAPEIEFSLPAYANEAQRIANEEDRIEAEQQRIANEDARIAAEETRQQNEQQRINQETARVNEFATLKSQSQAATRDANDAATLANQKAQLAADKAALADDAATLANQKAQLAADKAALANDAAQLANAKAALAQQKAEYAQQQGGYAKDQGDYAKNQGNYAKEQGDTALADHQRAEADHGIAVDDHTQAGNDHTRAESDHGIAVDDHTQAGNDHTRAESDHGFAADDHTQAGNDHTRAESDHGIAADDHTQAGNDHTRAESDHTRAESDHAAVEVYIDSLGVFDLSKHNAVGGALATYADLSAALTALNALDSKYKYGGMSFKFVLTSDNKYVQYRYLPEDATTTATFTNTADWQSENVDDTPAPMSTNLVTSRGIYISKYVKLVSISATAAESGVQKVGDIYYASNTNLIRICRLFVSEGSASNRFIDTTPLYDTLYSIDGMLYEWNGTTLIPSTIHIYNIEDSIKNDEGHIGIIKFKQGGYSGGDGSFNPTNSQRISSYPIYGGFKFTLKTGYKVTALCLFSNDGTFVRSIEGSDNKIEQGYYATITIGHNSSHPSGDNSKILPTEEPFGSYVSGQDYTNQINDVDIKRTLQLIKGIFRQGGANSEDGSFNPNNSKRISTYPIYSGVKYTLATGYKVTVINKYSYDGTFVETLDVSKTEHKVDNGYLIISIGHNASHASGDNSDIVPTETPFTSFTCGLPYLDYVVNSNKSNADKTQAELTDLSERVSLGFIQGGYSGANGELTPTNTKRISTTHIRYGAKYVLKSGYKISVIDRFADDGTFLGQSPVTGELSIDSGYFCMSIGHNYDNPNGNESVISPDENPFESIIFGDNYLHFNSSINDHTNWLSQYKESWSTLNCVPIFFKIASTSGSIFNLNIVIDTDFHYNLQYPERILQWTDWSVREAVKCFLCLGDMDLANSQPNKSIAMYNEHSQNVWNMFKSNKYNKAQLVTLGNHDLNVEAPVGQWATKAQQKAAYITPMIQRYGTNMGIVTDNNNSDGCYWYCDIQNSTNKVRIIGVDVFDYPTPTTNTSNIVTPDSANIDYDNNWVYWYFSDYIRDYPISGVANRRDLGLSVKQLQFIINALNTIPSGSTAIICGHTFGYFNADPSTISSLNETYWVGDSGRALLDIMKKFKENGSGEYSLISPISSTLQYDFTNAASNKVMMLQGHYHNFNKQVFEGIKLYTLIATDGNMNKPINLMSAKEACDILVMSNDGEDNADTIRFVRYGHVGRGTANLANDTDLTADAKGFHYIDNPESIYD